MITGSLVAIVTPMHPNGEIDWECYQQLLAYHIAQSTDGIVVAGTTGESATLTQQEQYELIGRTVDYVAGRLAVIASTGTNATAQTVLNTAEAKAAGVDACLIVTPYYNKPTQEGLYLHYKVIAEAVDIPQILYNVPGRTAVDMLSGTVAKLSEIDNIVGIKEATGLVDRVTMLRNLCGDDFALYSGDDATAMEFMLQGGNGVISVVNNVAPKLMHDLCVAAMSDNRTTAESINAKLAALSNTLFLEANPIPVKWALQQLEMIKGGIRLPLTALSHPHHASVMSALKQAELM